MSVILTDLFSIVEFSELIKISDKKYDHNHYEKVWHLIENIIISDKIYIDDHDFKKIDSTNFHEMFEGVFESIDNTLIQNSEYDSLRSSRKMQFKNEEERLSNIIYRSQFYLKIAEKLNSYFSPHPVRTNLLRDKLSNPDSAAQFVIQKFDKKITDTEVAQYASVNFNIPPVVEHVLYFAQKNDFNVIKAINIIRNGKNAVSFRKWCNKIDIELRESTSRKKIQTYQKLLKEIDSFAEKWKEDLMVGVKYKKRKLLLSKIWGVGKLFEMLDISEIELKDPLLLSSKPHFLFINDIYTK